MARQKWLENEDCKKRVKSGALRAGFGLEIMLRLLLVISLLVLVAAMVGRWWFGVRVLRWLGGMGCRVDIGRWPSAGGGCGVVRRSEGAAFEFGAELRRVALADWRRADARAAAAREGMRRFGQAVPPLSVVVAVFAVLVGKVPVFGGMVIVIGFTALAAGLGVLGLPGELVAIARAGRRMRDAGGLGDDEQAEAVIRCACAHAWDQSLPPMLRWFAR